MPTILTKFGYRFFFFSRENREPAHVHIEKDNLYAKFWLQPLSLTRSRKFKSHELTKIRKIIEENIELFRRRWNEHLDGQN